MTIADMKNIAAVVQKPIKFTGTSIDTNPPIYNLYVNENELKFISMAANNWDKLITIVEAAEELNRAYWNKESWSSWKIGPLSEALKALNES